MLSLLTIVALCLPDLLSSWLRRVGLGARAIAAAAAERLVSAVMPSSCLRCSPLTPPPPPAASIGHHSFLVDFGRGQTQCHPIYFARVHGGRRSRGPFFAFDGPRAVVQPYERCVFIVNGERRLVRGPKPPQSQRTLRSCVFGGALFRVCVCVFLDSDTLIF